MFSRRLLLLSIASWVIAGRQAVRGETILLPKPLAGNGFGEADNPLKARMMATRSVDALDAIAREHVVNTKRLAAVDGAIAEGESQLAELKTRKDTALSQLRAGLFCSKCKRSKVELEAQGINFVAHLAEVGGTQVSAAPEVIASKEQEFDKAILQLEQVQASRRQSKSNIERRETDLYEQFRQGIALWKIAIAFQATALHYNDRSAKAAEIKERAAAEKAQEKLRAELEGLTANGENKVRRTEIEAALAQLEKLTGQISTKAAQRTAEFQKLLAEADSNVASDRKRLRSFADVMVPNVIAVPSLPSMSVSAGDWGLDLGPTAIGVSFRFKEVVEIGLESTFDRESASAESKAFIQLFGHARAALRLFPDPKLEGEMRVPGLTDVEIKIVPPKTDGGWKNALPRP